MIPINPTVKLVIALVLVGGIGALQALVKVEPTWTWIGAIVQFLTVLEVYFTVPSGTAKRLAAKSASTIASALCLVGLCLFLTDCTPSQVAQAQTDTTQGIDLTNAVCSLAPDSPVGQPFVSVICTLLEGGEQLVNVVVGAVATLEGDGGTAASATQTSALMRVPLKQIEIQIPSTSAAKFLAAHRSKK